MNGEESVFIATAPAGRKDYRLLFAFTMVSAGIFLVAAPFASLPLHPVPTFIGLSLATISVVDLITGAMLLGQFIMLRNKALLALACGYLFNFAMAVAQGLSFPGLLAPNGVIGNGSQTTAWLYFFWHGGFLLFIGVYAVFKAKDAATDTTSLPHKPGVVRLVAASISATVVLAAFFILLATSSIATLPAIMQGNSDASNKIVVATITWLCTAITLAVLWRHRPHTKVDIGLMAILWVWIFDIALAAVLNSARYDLGWYVGRVYGVIGSSLVLLVLLLENVILYARLAQTHARELHERQRVQEKSAKLAALNNDLDQSNAALRDSSARMQSILDTALDGIITINATGCVESINPAALRMFGYTSVEVVGHNIRMLMPEPYGSEHSEYLARYIRTSNPQVIGSGREVLGLRKDGHIFPMSLSINEMWITNERKFTGVVSDITEHKMNEAKLITAKEQAENANRIKSSFLATMSHEIRTPLGGLLGMLELLGFSRLDAEQNMLLSSAYQSGKSLLRIVNDILDWSKIEDGKLTIAPTPTPIRQLLTEVVTTYSHVASGNDVILSQTVDQSLSPAHLVDSLRLSQILNNFVSNAIKFSRGGEVELRAELVEHNADGERVRFSVTDTGIGIAPEVQSRLFQNYGQGSADTARIYGGTGLGLAICRRLAGLMDADISLESMPGQGSTFSVALWMPIAEMPEVVTPVLPTPHNTALVSPSAHGDATAGAPHILVADDNPINRKLMALQLQRLGLLVDTAPDGAMAFTLWQQGKFALVITDCHMPGKDGYALAQSIRQVETQIGRARTPILAWTANALPSEEHKCQQAGMDELLVKPVDIAQLERVLPKYLAHPLASQPDSTATGIAATLARLDLNALSQQVGEDPAVQREFLSDFRESAAHIATDMSRAWKRKDTNECVALAHKLKSSARAVGAFALGDICAKMEAARWEIGTGSLDHLHPQFVLERDAVDALLRAHLAQTKEESRTLHG